MQRASTFHDKALLTEIDVCFRIRVYTMLKRACEGRRGCQIEEDRVRGSLALEPGFPGRD